MPTTIFRLFTITAFSLFSLTICHADTVHKCKNDQGKLMYQKAPCSEQEVSSWTPKTELKTTDDKEETKKKSEPLIIKQSRNGHYFVPAEVNSHNFIFVVDTGATVVSLPPAVASASSMFCNDKALVQTANGISKACTAKITEFKLGRFVLKDVDATITPNLKEPLLGMNVLQRFDIQQKDGEMRLSEQEKK